jgi:hypothetical protein
MKADKDAFNNTDADFGTFKIQGRSTFGKFCFDMRERLMSRVSKYGALGKNYPKKVHALDSLIRRLDAYVATGNTEYLIDAANFAYIEYTYPSHPQAFNAPVDDKFSPGLVIRTDGITREDMG